MIRPIYNYPALLIKNSKSIKLVVADIHIGFEKELVDKGIRIPSQTDKLLNKIVNIALENNVDEVVLLGDIKHTIPKPTRRELSEIARFIEKLTERFNVAIIPGNHDGGLRELVRDYKGIKFQDARGMVLELEDTKIGLLHGHTWPSPKLLTCKTIILGHTHPVVEFYDSFGFRYTLQVWVKVPIDREILVEVYPKKLLYEYGFKSIDDLEVNITHVIVMPAFNNYLSGNSINSSETPRPLLGPLLESKAALIGESEIFLLDGTYLGKLEHLKKYAKA